MLYIRTVSHIFDKCGSSGQRVFQTVFDKSVRSRTCIIFVLSARICRRVLFSTNRNVLVFDKSGSFVFIYSVNYRAVFSCPVVDKTKQSGKLCFPDQHNMLAFPDHTCVFPTAYKKTARQSCDCLTDSEWKAATPFGASIAPMKVYGRSLVAVKFFFSAVVLI